MLRRASTAAILIVATLCPIVLHAQLPQVELRSVKISATDDARAIGDAFITFRFDDATVDPSYMDNLRQLDALAATVGRFRMNIDSVTVIAFASPEGRSLYNQRLSERRARAMRNYLTGRWSDVDFGHISEYAGGPDFAGLSQALALDPDIPCRSEVMAIVSDWGTNPDAGFRRLMELQDGEPYLYIQEKYLPWLRNATTVIFHYDRTTSLFEEKDSVVVSVVVEPAAETRGGDITVTDVVGAVSADAALLPPAASSQLALLPPGTDDTTKVLPVAVKYLIADPVVQTPEPEKNVEKKPGEKPEKPAKPAKPEKPVRERHEKVHLDCPPFGGISTNLLYDAATAVNLGLEIPLGRRWALSAQFIFPWWTWNGGSNAFQLNHGNLGVRRWFNPTPYEGWYLSGILGGGRFDIEPSKTGWRGREFLAGVGGGCSIPLSKSWNLDLGLDIGAIYTTLDQYQELDGGVRAVTQADRSLLLIAPTDLHITLIYLFYPW